MNRDSEAVVYDVSSCFCNEQNCGEMLPFPTVLQEIMETPTKAKNVQGTLVHPLHKAKIETKKSV
jgi:hypothetical protein